ncbi:MAG: hypothetical protein A2V88_08355 [Elusimicrobia bacterium RBG_16_66_12]|nr:MAG: hypothetical protein A2V88_08355 [Elusimicrobia bacterium RBG_16_66_12]
MPGEAREARALRALMDGDGPVDHWWQLEIEGVDHVLSIAVGREPWRVGSGADSVQVAVSHYGAQRIVDAAGWTLGSARLHDAIVRAATTWGAFIPAEQATAIQIWGPATKGAPAMTRAMVDASRYRDELGASGAFVAGPWKEWISDARLRQPAGLPLGKKQGVNYGFWTPAPAVAPPTPGPRPSATIPALRVWQQPGLAHDYWHSDYSQLLRPIWGQGWITGPRYPDGALVDLDTIATDAQLWRLVRHDGPGSLRHPWIPRGEAGPPGSTPLVVTPRSTWPRVAAAGIVGAGIALAAVAYEVRL